MAHPNSYQLRSTNKKGNFSCPDSSQITRLCWILKTTVWSLDPDGQRKKDLTREAGFIQSSGGVCSHLLWV